MFQHILGNEAVAEQQLTHMLEGLFLLFNGMLEGIRRNQARCDKHFLEPGLLL